MQPPRSKISGFIRTFLDDSSQQDTSNKKPKPNPVVTVQYEEQGATMAIYDNESHIPISVLNETLFIDKTNVYITTPSDEECSMNGDENLNGSTHVTRLSDMGEVATIVPTANELPTENIERIINVTTDTFNIAPSDVVHHIFDPPDELMFVDKSYENGNATANVDGDLTKENTDDGPIIVTPLNDTETTAPLNELNSLLDNPDTLNSISEQLHVSENPITIDDVGNFTNENIDTIHSNVAENNVLPDDIDRVDVNIEVLSIIGQLRAGEYTNTTTTNDDMWFATENIDVISTVVQSHDTIENTVLLDEVDRGNENIEELSILKQVNAGEYTDTTAADDEIFTAESIDVTSTMIPPHETTENTAG
jgi:hypothetical protein